MDTLKTNRFWFLTSLIGAVALVRLLSLPIHNFAPIGAMALFGGVYFKDKLFAFLVPLMALFVTDVIIELMGGPGFYKGMIAVYAAFFMVGCIGLLIRNQVNFRNVVAGALASSILFFLITNFATWLGNPFYTQNLGGLMTSYAAGLAFYRNEIFGSFFFNTVLGDLFFTGVLIGAYALGKAKMPVLVKA